MPQQQPAGAGRSAARRRRRSPSSRASRLPPPAPGNAAMTPPAHAARRPRRSGWPPQSTGLVATGLGKRYRKRPVVRNVSISLQARRGGRAARPERRRQDHDLLHDHRPGAARRGHRSPWTATTSPPCRCTAAPASASATCRRRPRSSAACRVEDNIRAALEVVEPMRDRREQMLDALLAEFGIAPSAPRPRAGAVGRRAAALRDRPRAGDPALPTSCSTSRWPASTRSPSARSATW